MRSKADHNQSELLRNLRTIPGLSVVDLSGVGRGCPDLLIGYQGKNYLVEVKNRATWGKLNARQKEWFSTWTGQAMVVLQAEDIFKYLFPKLEKTHERKSKTRQDNTAAEADF